MAVAPAAFDGTRSGFIKRHLEPLLPDVRAVEGFHRGLVEYLAGADKKHSRPTGWTGAAKLLSDGQDEGLAAVARLDIGGIARVGARIVSKTIRMGERPRHSLTLPLSAPP